MSTTLTSLAADINQKKLTGLLSLVVNGSGSHFKIFFTDGEIYHCLYENLKDAECFANFDKLEFKNCFFLVDVKCNHQGKIVIPISEFTNRLKKIDKIVTAPPPESGGTARVSTEEFTAIQDKLKVALIRQIGPVGEFVFSNVMEKWPVPSRLTRQSLVELIDFLKKEIKTDNNQQDFMKEACAIIS